MLVISHTFITTVLHIRLGTARVYARKDNIAITYNKNSYFIWPSITVFKNGFVVYRVVNDKIIVLSHEFYMWVHKLGTATKTMRTNILALNPDIFARDK